jgi:hypothetical protein
MKEKSIRSMKVYRAFHYHARKSHPVIRIGGKYLAKLGFKIGDRISIELSSDCIHITKQESNERKVNTQLLLL